MPAQAQGQKAPVGGVPGLPPVPPDVVPGKVAAGAAVHVIPPFINGHIHHLAGIVTYLISQDAILSVTPIKNFVCVL